MAELYLLRHGQASLGTDNYDRLSQRGHTQATMLSEYFKARDIVFDCFICGSMQRHHETLAPIREKQQLIEDSSWNEYDFESIIRAFIAEYPDMAHMLKEGKRSLFKLLKIAMLAWAKGEIKTPVAESWGVFQERVNHAYEQVLKLSAKRVLVVSSGGVISSFIGKVLGLAAEDIVNLNMQIKNASIHHFYFNKQGFQLSAFNSITAFDSPEHKSLITST